MSKTKNAWDEISHDDEKDGKILTPDVSSLIVRIIEDDTNMLHKTLGISQKNSRRLQDIIHDQFTADRKGDVALSNASTLMVKLSEACTHANELAFACFALGKITSDMDKPRGGRSHRIGAIGVNRDTGEIKRFGGDGEDMPDFIKDVLKDILKGKKGRRDRNDDDLD